MCLSTPHLRTIQLPCVCVDPTVDFVIGTHELYAEPLIFDPSTRLERGIDQVLQYHDSPRCIVEPVIALAPANQSPYLSQWGMSTVSEANLSPWVLACLESDKPATSPPTTMMEILTPLGSRNITILPKPDANFVTSSDVQKEVAKWMKEMTELPEIPLSFSQAEKFSLPDGREIDIELWHWRGLKRHGEENNVWNLFL